MSVNLTRDARRLKISESSVFLSIRFLDNSEKIENNAIVDVNWAFQDEEFALSVIAIVKSVLK